MRPRDNQKQKMEMGPGRGGGVDKGRRKVRGSLLLGRRLRAEGRWWRLAALGPSQASQADEWEPSASLWASSLFLTSTWAHQQTLWAPSS